MNSSKADEGSDNRESGPTQEMLVRKIMSSATIRCNVEIVSHNLDWGRSSKDTEVRVTEKVFFQGTIMDSYRCEVLAGKACQISFYLLPHAGKLADDGFGDPVVGFLEYYSDRGQGDLVAFNIPSTDVLLDKVRALARLLSDRAVTSLYFSFLVNDLFEGWEPRPTVDGKPSLWLNHVSVSCASKPIPSNKG